MAEKRKMDKEKTEKGKIEKLNPVRIHKKVSEWIKISVTSDKSRQRMIFCFLNAALSLSSLAMSVVNLFTSENILFIFTISFFALCLLNILALHLFKMNEKLVYYVFCAESLSLMLAFLISGIPSGFSALWICLVPSFALLTFVIKKGTVFSAVTLGVIVFFFWIPFGRSLLMYSYTEVFMLRFPLLYCSVYVTSLLIEMVRKETQLQLEQAKEKYNFLYCHDQLTGLYNRYGIEEYLKKAFSTPACEKSGASVIIVDVDDFKNVNDAYGHECGDEILKSIAEILKETVCDHCYCCRWGGEEFLIVMRCDHDTGEIAESIRRKVEQNRVSYNEKEVGVTVSAGACVALDPLDVNMHEIIDKADRALYLSKSKGKNTVTVCTA